MVAKIPFLLAICAALFLANNLAWGDSYRCGRKIVRTGDAVSTLVEVCGEPRHKGRGKHTLMVDGRLRQVTVQQWHYRMGSRRLGRVVMIYRGKIAAIEVARR